MPLRVTCAYRRQEQLGTAGRQRDWICLVRLGLWRQMELLKQIAPVLTRVAVMRDSATPSQMGLFGAMQSLAPSLASFRFCAAIWPHLE